MSITDRVSLAFKCIAVEHVQLAEVALPAHVSRILLKLALRDIDLRYVLTQIAQGLIKDAHDFISFVLDRDWLEVCGVDGSHVHQLKVRLSLELILVLGIGQKVVHDNAYAFLIFAFHLFVLMHVAVQTQHVEKHIYREHLLARKMK